MDDVIKQREQELSIIKQAWQEIWCKCSVDEVLACIKEMALERLKRVKGQ